MTYQRGRRQSLRTSVGMAVAALGIGGVAQIVAGPRMGDLLTPANLDADRRVIVFAFDGLGSGIEVAHLRATYYKDIATVAAGGGAGAIVYLDFDSLAFSDGSSGRSNVVGSSTMQELGIGPLLDVARQPSDGRLPFATGYRVDPLASELAGVGVGTIDQGGVIRSVPAGIRLDDLRDGAIVGVGSFGFEAADIAARTIVPGVAFRAVELATGDPISEITASSVRLGDDRVPLERGDLRIRFSDELDDADDGQVVTLADLQMAPFPDGFFRDAIVVVGTADRAASSYVDTPHGAMADVFVQANAINTLLHRQYLQPAPPAAAWSAAVAGVGGLVVLSRRRWSRLALAAIIGSVLWAISVWWAAGRGHLVLALLPPTAFVAATMLIGVVRQVDGAAERRRLRDLFAQYVPPSVAEQLVASGRADSATAGERAAITALFCDLRGFTPVAARLEPSQVRELLNTYYEHLARVVLSEGGTVLQYTGDEIFAVFGAPLPMTDHAPAGLRCARRMFDALAGLNDALRTAGLPPLNFGIGLHSGDVIAAHIGSSVRMQYSVIGDAVNVANRHCTLAREGQIVVSAVTAALIGPIDDAVPSGEIELKGVSGTRTTFVVHAGPSNPSGSPLLDRGVTLP